MSTIEEQKQVLRNRNKLQPEILATQEIANEKRGLISHKAAVKLLLQNCKISEPANGDKTVVYKEVKATKTKRVVTSIDYILIEGKLQRVEETKEVEIKNYFYLTRIKTDIQTLQGVK